MKKILSMLAVTVLVLTGCGSSTGNSVTVGGSTSVQPLLDLMISDYTAEFPDVEVTYDATGSGAGIEGVKSLKYEVGTSSRELKDTEAEGLVVDTIALDGISVIVNPNNPVKELTMEQLVGIYTGEITNWSEVGGNDASIAVYARDSASGTRTAFEEIVGFNTEDTTPMTNTANQSASNGEIATSISSNESAIGYVSFSTLISDTTSSVVGVSIDGAQPTVENVQNDSYPIVRPFELVYLTDNTNQATLDFIAWIEANVGDYLEIEGLIEAK